MTHVLICIQARSGSKRLPGKALKVIDDRTMVEHVIEAAKSSVNHLNKGTNYTGIHADYVCLIPTGDVLKRELSAHPVIEGPEDDVLTRFDLAAQSSNPDFIVRITGDCPLIIPTIINKHVTSAVSLGLDYVSNSFDDLRTFVDGYDCEVLSVRALDWLVDNALTPYDREHVTTLIKREPPEWVKFGVVLGYTDLSDVKLSVDTIDELMLVREKKKALTEKCKKARMRDYAVFRF